MNSTDPDALLSSRPSVIEVFLTFLRLGLTSFGGPVAHLGYFRTEFVERRRWLSEHAYADLVGLCQFLPGPASSQVGIAIGLSRAGLVGAIAAWIGFTLPSAAAMILFALGVSHLGTALGSGGLHGLKVVAVAVVAQALWQMGKSLCPDRSRATLAVAAAVAVSFLPTAVGQIICIVCGAGFGLLLLAPTAPLPHAGLRTGIRWHAGIITLTLFFGFLIALPVLDAATNDHLILLVNAFYRSGALVFGGGHVVLPLLQTAVVGPGWVNNETFLAGYGAAQAIPGPLFTFAAYLGAAAQPEPSGWLGGVIAVIAIFLPGFLLVIGVLPFWETLRHYEKTRRAMAGINAAVVGILLSAFYQPVWTSAIQRPIDFGIAATAFLLLVFWKLPPWLVVLLSAIAGIATARVP